MKNFSFRLSIAILWFIFLTVLLTLPGSSFPKEDWFSTVRLDKWIHGTLFAILVVLWCRPFPGKRIGFYIRIAILAFIYGVITEFIQKYFVPNRSFDIADIAADAFGSTVGFFIYSRVYIKK